METVCSSETSVDFHWDTAMYPFSYEILFQRNILIEAKFSGYIRLHHWKKGEKGTDFSDELIHIRIDNHYNSDGSGS
jgi:hypothetical protein